MSHEPARQGFAANARERLPLPTEMDEAQRAAADALIRGPRGAVYGPFVPLLRNPPLLNAVGQTGEVLRFHGRLDARVRELVTCAVARHTSNQFEWVMHAPLAEKAGVSPATIAAIAAGARPRELPRDEECALDVVRELVTTHGVSDATYADALAQFGEAGVVELVTLVGYFTMVCWLMNVARTPARGEGAGLAAWPA